MGFLNKLKNAVTLKKEDAPAPKQESKPENRSSEYGEFRPQAQARPQAKAPKEKPAANHGEAWTPGEEKHLKENYDKGVSIEELSKMHGRTYQAISHRLIYLGYPGISTAKRHR
ncbi:MAG: hypothetical protein LBH69_04975 [Methanomassiliicoccaceae archaeon]|nr:hypothetical protein [Methanomassiliicoccaceae archaeon]